MPPLSAVDFNETPLVDALKVIEAKLTASATNHPIRLQYFPGYDGNDLPVGVAATNDPAIPMPVVSLTGQNIPALVLFRSLGVVSGQRYLIRDGMVLFIDRDAPESPILVRHYDVQSSFSCRIRVASEGLTRPSESIGDDLMWKTFMQEMGVPWPRGSMIRHIPSIGTLIVHNTAANLAIFDRVFSKLNVTPNQVDIEATMVVFPRKEIEPLAAKGRISQAQLKTLYEEGKGMLLAAPRVITQSGSEATVKACREYIYPTEFSVATSVMTDPSSTAAVQVVRSVVEPSSFETREIGCILTAIPEVSPEGRMITLALSAEIILPPEWKDFGSSYEDSNGRVQQAHMEQPLFFVHQCNTTVSFRPGKRVLVAGGGEHAERDYLYYLFVSVQLVAPDGEPIPEYDDSWLVPPTDEDNESGVLSDPAMTP